jgi:plasmid stabilization system protein ParE
MPHRIVIQHDAETDITDAAIWYHQKQPGLGQEFLAEVETTLTAAAANPSHYHRLRRKPDVRRAITNRFPYRIFFVLHPETIVVFRVLHHARHDREWKANVPK